MKKHIRNTSIALLLFLTFATGVFANEAYRNWKGTDDYHTVLDNLKLIKQNGNDLQHDLDLSEHSNAELKVIIQQKEQIILTLEKEIEDLKATGNANSSELNQAEKDMKHLKEETDKLVEGMK